MTDQPKRPQPLVRDPRPLGDLLMLRHLEDPPATTRTTFVAALRSVLSMALEERDVALIDDERLGEDPLPGEQPIEVERRIRWYRRGSNGATITMVNRIVSRIEQAFDDPLTGLAAMQAKEAEGGFHLGADRARELHELMRACRAVPPDADDVDVKWNDAAADVVEWLECHTSLGEGP